MADPEIAVSISDIEFSIGEIQEFLDTARGIPTMVPDAIVTVERLTDDGPYVYILRASTGYRSKQ